MQTRRDQLHAYRFMTRRAMSALVTGDPDTVEPPMRRLTVTTLMGVMVAIVVAAVFAVIGLLRPGAGDEWRQEGSVIVERETGSRFLMIEGELHHASNFASAVLASGATTQVKVHLVSREDLASVERGPAIGTPTLPDSMPEPEDLVDGPISVCSQAVPDGASVRTQVSVSVGMSPEMDQMPSDDAVYAQAVDGGRYLLWRGERHEIDRKVISVLGISERPVILGRALLTSLPQGAPLRPPVIESLGQKPSMPDAHGMVVGQVIDVSDGSKRVMLRDGIASVTDIQARLLLTLDLKGRESQRPKMSLAAVSEMAESPEAVADLARQTDGLPATMPTLSDATADAGGVCATYDGEQQVPTFTSPAGVAPASPPTEDGELSAQGIADEVLVKPNAGVLARAPKGAAVNLIAEPGLRYPAANLEVLGGFGYGTEEPIGVPAELLLIIPTGDALDPAAALAQSSSQAG